MKQLYRKIKKERINKLLFGRLTIQYGKNDIEYYNEGEMVMWIEKDNNMLFICVDDIEQIIGSVYNRAVHDNIVGYLNYNGKYKNMICYRPPLKIDYDHITFEEYEEINRSVIR